MLKMAAVALLGMIPLSANASTINFFGDDGLPNLLRGTLTCSLTCEGLLTSGAFSPTRADMRTVHPPSAANELAFVNSVVPETFISGIKTDDPGNFTSNALYILFKIGGGNTFATTLIMNTAGAVQSYSYIPVAGTGSGLSHINEFGVIPIPAAGVLLISALAGLGFASRRRRKA